MAKGRDTWDYLVYYLQLFDSDPPLSQVQLFRAPLTPLVVGLPMDLGGSRPARGRLRRALRRLGRRVERDGAHLRPDPRARVGRAPPRLSRLGDALPPGVERRGLHDRSRGLGPDPREDDAAAVDARLRRAGPRPRGARADPAREPGAAPRRARAAAGGGGALAAQADLGRGLLRGGGAAARRLGRPQRRPLRRPHRHARRPGVGAVPARVHRRPVDLARERCRVAAARAGSSRTRSSPRSRSRPSASRSTRTSRTGRTTRPSG